MLRSTQAQINSLSPKLLDDPEWSFLTQIATIDLEGADGISTYLSSVRALMNKALQISVQDLNLDTIASILKFVLEHMLTLTVQDRDLAHLVKREAYDVISLLVTSSVQLERERRNLNVGKVTM